jgi:hypothetical protein
MIILAGRFLYAALVEQETNWAHIKTAESEMLTYGIPPLYHVVLLRVFQLVQGRDSVWRKHVLKAGEVDPQWRQVTRTLGLCVSFALSDQAKGCKSSA